MGVHDLRLALPLSYALWPASTPLEVPLYTSFGRREAGGEPSARRPAVAAVVAAAASAPVTATGCPSLALALGFLVGASVAEVALSVTPLPVNPPSVDPRHLLPESAERERTTCMYTKVSPKCFFPRFRHCWHSPFRSSFAVVGVRRRCWARALMGAPDETYEERRGHRGTGMGGKESTGGG